MTAQGVACMTVWNKEHASLTALSFNTDQMQACMCEHCETLDCTTCTCREPKHHTTHAVSTDEMQACVCEPCSTLDCARCTHARVLSQKMVEDKHHIRICVLLSEQIEPHTEMHAARNQVGVHPPQKPWIPRPPNLPISAVRSLPSWPLHAACGTCTPSQRATLLKD